MTSIFASVSVLIVGWQLGTTSGVVATTASTANSGTSTSGTGSSGTGTSPTDTSPGTDPIDMAATDDGSPSTTTRSTSPSAVVGAGTHLKNGSFTGTSVATRFGDVQVQVVVHSGTITDVVALALTDKDRKSVQISNRAAPILRSEVLDSQSSQVATVGGATYTSDGYRASLQSALDLAKA